MSKATATKTHRMFVGRTLQKLTNRGISETIELAKRLHIISPKERHYEPCTRCGEKMHVADGQIARFHAQCKKQGKRIANKNK